MNIFTKQNWFTCTSITSRKLHLQIRPVLKLLAKDSHTEPIFCFDWIPIVVFDNPEEDDCSNTVDASSARLDSATVHNQGRSQDFSVGTHSFPSHLFTPPPPPKKKIKVIFDSRVFYFKNININIFEIYFFIYFFILFIYLFIFFFYYYFQVRNCVFAYR